VGGLALIGGLATACFAKAFGAVFLGEPRSPEALASAERGPAMRGPMIVLAALCAAIGLAPVLLLPMAGPLLSQVTGLDVVDLSIQFSGIRPALGSLTALSLGLTLAVVLGAWALRRLSAGRRVDNAPTWGCGYPHPSPRMQYTASSFSEILLSVFGPLLRARRFPSPVTGLFPQAARFSTELHDAFQERVYRPSFIWIRETLYEGKRIQHGRLQFYVLYIVVTLAVLLAVAL
jgi:hydrogenase-4 component B